MSKYNLVVDQPVPLNQNKLGYDLETGWFACWVAAAEMVKTVYKPGARIRRPGFNPPSRANTSEGMDERIAFFLKQESHLLGLGFVALHKAGKAWSAQTLFEALSEWGALYAYGLFFLDDNNMIFSPVPPTPANRMNGVQHAICVVGVSEYHGRVYYIDPWNGEQTNMSIADFTQRLHPMNVLAVSGCEDNRQVRARRAP